MKLACVLASVAFIVPSFAPVALEEGSITPVRIQSAFEDVLSVPSFNNKTLIQEYPSEVDRYSPFQRGVQGLFAYAVGTNS